MSDCPECDQRLPESGPCRKCGWAPTPEPVTAPLPKVLPAYREFPKREYTPESDTTREEILAMLERVKQSLAVAAPAVTPRVVDTGFNRCPDCENGRLIHMGVRFCAACLVKL